MLKGKERDGHLGRKWKVGGTYDDRAGIEIVREVGEAELEAGDE